MRSVIRWMIVVVVLTIVGVIALWPRERVPATPVSGGATPWTLEEPGRRTAPAPDDAALAGLRQRAALQPCPAPPPDAPAPSGPLAGITVPCLGAPGTVDLAAALAGRPALLNVWASWCPPCREEMPVLAAYASQQDAVAVIGIDVQDRPADALTLLADLEIHYPSVTDPQGSLQRALQAPPILPISYVLRPDGSVEMISPPRVFRAPEQVHQSVNRLLEPPQPVLRAHRQPGMPGMCTVDGAIAAKRQAQAPRPTARRALAAPAPRSPALRTPPATQSRSCYKSGNPRRAR